MKWQREIDQLLPLLKELSIREAAQRLGIEEGLPCIEYGDLDPRVAWIAEHVAHDLAVRGC